MMPLQRACDAESQVRNKLSNGPLRAQSNVSFTEYSATLEADVICRGYVGILLSAQGRSCESRWHRGWYLYDSSLTEVYFLSGAFFIACRTKGETMIKEAIVKIVNKEDLTYDEAYTVMNEIMSGETTPTQNAAFLAALSTKSARAETTDEIAGCAAAMRAHATRVDTGMEVFEIVGTGGDNAHSFNISTTSALVAAAGGMKVAKHGNRAASSQCGTADCLEALGVNIQQSPARCIELLNEAGMCFFFAQKYHTSMKYVGAIRKELGFRTVFNILGPLTNPGAPSLQLLGVYDDYLVEPLAQVLINLGVRRGMVVYGQDKLDEISMSAPTSVCEIKDGWFRSSVITPEDFGLKRCTREDLKGGSPEENAQITRAILNGEKGPRRDAVLMNAGASLYIGGKAASMKDGIILAADLIDSGKALKTLEKLIEISNRPEEVSL